MSVVICIVGGVLFACFVCLLVLFVCLFVLVVCLSVMLLFLFTPSCQ